MYKEWEVEGLKCKYERNRPNFKRRKLTVRYTSDEIGKSLSIADEYSNVMLSVPVDRIIKEIMEAEQNEN